MRIDRVQGPAPVAGRARAAPASGFDAALNGETAAPAEAAAAEPLAAPPGPWLPDPQAAPVRDREARRHGRAVLEALGGLQLALLSGDVAGARAALAGLTASPPEADDPALRLILEEINIRAAVELARPETTSQTGQLPSGPANAVLAEWLAEAGS